MRVKQDTFEKFLDCYDWRVSFELSTSIMSMQGHKDCNTMAEAMEFVNDLRDEHSFEVQIHIEAIEASQGYI